jgi:hypothetical protein
MNILHNRREYGSIHNTVELLKTRKKDREIIAGDLFIYKDLKKMDY